MKRARRGQLSARLRVAWAASEGRTPEYRTRYLLVASQLYPNIRIGNMIEDSPQAPGLNQVSWFTLHLCYVTLLTLLTTL